MDTLVIQAIELKKRLLKKYRRNLLCIGRLEEKLESLDEKIKSIRSPNYSGMPRGGTPVTIEELLSDKVDLEKRIKRLKVKGRRLKNEILDEIDTLEDPRYCEVLEAYFIDCKNIGEIADEMGYTDRYIYDLYKEAIKELVFSEAT